jgi:hypothetical protein
MLGSGRVVAMAAAEACCTSLGGVNVLLARLVAGRHTDTWQLDGNLLFQKPLAADRDAVDLITSIGWTRRVANSVSLGFEAVGEDLEGFWESEEAEGGARLLVGPSVRVSPADRRWQLIATGGPLFHPSDTRRSSGAFRDLPPIRAYDYAFKVSLSVFAHIDSLIRIPGGMSCRRSLCGSNVNVRPQPFTDHRVACRYRHGISTSFFDRRPADGRILVPNGQLLSPAGTHIEVNDRRSAWY